MIYTVTMNLTFEFVSEATDFKFDKNNIFDFDLMLPAGEGANASRILKQFNLPAVATGSAGGSIGESVEGWFRKEDTRSEFIRIDDSTRINIRITGATETVVESKGSSTSHQGLQGLLYYLSRVKEGNTAFLSMALPKNIIEAVIEGTIAIYKANETQLVLDTDGYYLEKLTDEGPPLENISIECSEHLFKTKINSESDLLKQKSEILHLNSKFVVVPFVENRVYLSQKDFIYTFEIDEITNQKRDSVIDSITAGFIATFIRASGYEKSFEMANACARALLKTRDLPKKFQMGDCFDDINTVKID